MKFYYSFLFLFLLPILIFSQTKVPSFFSDGMVLQQNQEVAFWGWDNGGQDIDVFTGWGEKISSKTKANGEWRIKMKTPQAGGPYSIRIEGSEIILLEDILIGEVWFCSGQSNMEMPLTGYRNEEITGSQETILNSENENIRMFTVKRNAQETPQTDLKGNWLSAKPAIAGSFSAVAYFFAKKLHKQLKVPIGIIHSSWGGSKIEAWIDKKNILEFPEIELLDKLPEQARLHNKTPTWLYNGMVHPIAGYGIKGFCWYQGESNRGRPDRYVQLSKTMVELWRNKWGDEKLPFYYVQIAPFGYNDVNSAIMREAQQKCMNEIENSGMVITMDIGDCISIHPAEKKLVGRRLAYWALSKDYGVEGIIPQGPSFKNMELLDKGKIKIHFDFAPGGLTTYEKKLSGFEIAASDQKFIPANAVINWDRTITVWSEEINEPQHVRYAFDNCTEGTLFNTMGLPASSFRTDDWPFE